MSKPEIDYEHEDFRECRYCGYMSVDPSRFSEYKVGSGGSLWGDPGDTFHLCRFCENSYTCADYPFRTSPSEASKAVRDINAALNQHLDLVKEAMSS